MPDTTVEAAGEAMPVGPSSEYFAAWKKCKELGTQLSQALAQTGDDEFAFIKPCGMSFPVCFGQIRGDIKSPVEQPVQTLDRMAHRIAIALDDWAEQTGWKSAAHIYPASSGRGLYFEKLGTSAARVDAAALSTLVDRHRAAIQRYDQCSDEDWSCLIGEITAELSASAKAILEYRPTTRAGLRAKAEYMLSSKAFTEWDDFDRADIIRSLLIEEVLA